MFLYLVLNPNKLLYVKFSTKSCGDNYKINYIDISIFLQGQANAQENNICKKYFENYVNQFSTALKDDKTNKVCGIFFGLGNRVCKLSMCGCLFQLYCYDRNPTN